jgi:hypothetical protein
MVKQYDEDAVLTKYMWRNYRHLMSEAEVLAGEVVIFREKAKAVHHPHRSSMYAERERNFTARPGVADLVNLPVPEFRRRVRDRLMREHSHQINLNRCPKCDRIPATPMAKQCPWCYHSWRV